MSTLEASSKLSKTNSYEENQQAEEKTMSLMVEDQGEVDSFRILAICARLWPHFPLFLKLTGYYLLVPGIIMTMLCFDVASLELSYGYNIEAEAEELSRFFFLTATNMLLDAFLHAIFEAAMTHALAVICLGRRPILTISLKKAVLHGNALYKVNTATYSLVCIVWVLFARCLRMMFDRARDLIERNKMALPELFWFSVGLLLFISIPGLILMFGSWFVALPCCLIENTPPRRALERSKQLSKGRCCSFPVLLGAALFVVNHSFLFVFNVFAVEKWEQQHRFFPDFFGFTIFYRALVGFVFYPAMAILRAGTFLRWRLETEGKGMAALRQDIFGKDDEDNSEQNETGDTLGAPRQDISKDEASSSKQEETESTLETLLLDGIQEDVVIAVV